MKYYEISEIPVSKENFDELGVVAILGEDAMRVYNDTPCDEKVSLEKLREWGDVKFVLFDTSAERDAYIQGLQDACGWFENGIASISEFMQS